MNPFLTARHAVTGVALAIASAAFLALAIFASVQTARIEGFHLWPVSITGWKKTAQIRERERDAERTAHQQTKVRIEETMLEAERLEQQRLGRVRKEQQEISDAIRQDYTSRLATVRARADSLRRDLQARTQSAAQPAGLQVPGIPAPPAGSAAAPEDPRLPSAALAGAEQLERDLIATEQALQLDALIDFVLRQAAIDPNTSPQENTP